MDRITNLLGAHNPAALFPGHLAGDERARASAADTAAAALAYLELQLQKTRQELARQNRELQQQICARLRMERQMKAAVAEKQSLLEALPDAVYRLNSIGAFLPPPVSRQQLGPWPTSGLAGKTLHQLCSPQTAGLLMFHIGQSLGFRHIQRFQFAHPLKDTAEAQWDCQLVAESRDQVLLLIRPTLVESPPEEILRAVDTERGRIGQDLHDSVGQQLSGIKFLCTGLIQKTSRGEPIAGADLAFIEEQVNIALSETRSIAKGLSLVDLDQKPLDVALREMAARLCRLAIDCNVRCASPVHVPSDMKRELVLIAQEATGNAIKHGCPRHITIDLGSDADSLVTLKITNDGLPFSRSNNSSGIGLNLMERRARKVGGSFSISPEPGGGATVLCIIPRSH